MSRIFIAIALLVTATLGFAQTPNTSNTTESYLVSAEDTLSITTRDVTEATGDFLVRQDGYIAFPLAGEVKVAGLTTTEIRKRLVDLLKKEIKDPDVTVNVKVARVQRTYVFGSIARPGITDWKPNWRLTELVAAAGGLTLPPERVKAIIFRVGQPNVHLQMKSVLVDAIEADNVLVLPGDTVNFQSDVQIRVVVIGDVRKPGVTAILAGQGVVEALAAADGPTDTARLSKAHIVRKGQNIDVDLYKAVTLGQSSINIPLEENDTLYVPKLVSQISVFGSVGKPGPILVPDGKDITVTQAIALAGGPVSQAKLDGVTIARVGPDGKIVTTKVNLKALLHGNRQQPDPILQDKDIVYVAESGKPGFREFQSIVTFLLLGRNLTK